MIFYFSATGNSKYLAEQLACEGERILSMPAVQKAKEFSYDVKDEPSVGFVCPVYFAGLPSVVAAFLDQMQLQNTEEKYIYLVLSCGGASSNAGKMFRDLLAQKGYTLSTWYSVKMVDNYVVRYTVPSDKQITAILEDAEDKIDEIKEKIAAKAQGDQDEYKGFAPSLLTRFLYPLYLRGRKTARFTVDKNCTGCGLCAQLCPTETIVMAENRPHWQKESCCLCLSCLHRCPEEAINYGESTADRGRYFNPYTAPE